MDTVEALALPVCKPCREKAIAHNRRTGPAPRPNLAEFGVFVGASQIERFECVTCNAETQNPIRFRLELVEGRR